jgi:hypothetical protein
MKVIRDLIAFIQNYTDIRDVERKDARQGHRGADVEGIHKTCLTMVLVVIVFSVGCEHDRAFCSGECCSLGIKTQRAMEYVRMSCPSTGSTIPLALASIHRRTTQERRLE